MGLSSEDIEKIAKASADEITKRLHKPGTTKYGATTELTQKWFKRGIAVGKTDGWMDIENTLKETAERHPGMKDSGELVWTDIDGWETTDHFNVLYGSKIMADAKGDVDLYADLKSEFWEGYLAGRKEIGVDIYKIASELVKGG